MFSLLVVLAGAISTVTAQCTAERRIDTMKYITAAFNEKDFAKSAALIQGMPLQADCPAVVHINGAPGIQFGFDAATTKDFANVVRQAFTNVVSEYTDYNTNGTTLMDADVTLGALHYIDLPANAHILVPAEFNLTTCLLSKLPAFVQVPSAIGGNPINLPSLPAIPGASELPGLREFLKILAPLLNGGA